VDVERRTTENESAGGYGAIIQGGKNSWVRVGKLLAIKAMPHTRYAVGTVRRFATASVGQSYVGIEVLTPNPIAVVLRSETRELSSYGVTGMDQVVSRASCGAIYVTGDSTKGVENTLIMESEMYAKNKECDMRARTNSYKIVLSDSVEAGFDWVRCTFKVVKKT
jgi:hypothetical protein